MLIGTLRADGWPRISPTEIYFVDGQLMLGMMPQSKKSLDLLREGRITVATPQCDREAKRGEVKETDFSKGPASRRSRPACGR